MTIGACLLVLLALAAAPTQEQPGTNEGKIPVLLVTGANNHDWQWTSSSLASILEESGRFTVTTTRNPAEILADPETAEKYRAYVLDYNGPAWDETAQERFLETVRQGMGVAVIHASNNAFPGWVEYEKLVGLCWREGTSHGAFHAFDARVTDRDHPITATLPDLLQHPDELYHGLVPMHGVENRVLATALSSKESGGSGRTEPVIIVREYGKGRVFHTPLGHVWAGQSATRASYIDVQFRNLVVRGVEWAATGAVRDGTPAPNRLTSLEAESGWQLLFDGKTPAGWHAASSDVFPEQGWYPIYGVLRHLAGAGGGDLVSTDSFEDFELEFEWKSTSGAEGGVVYRAQESAEGMVGPEYQVVDDAGHAAGREPRTSSGSIESLFEPAPKELHPAGAFNRGRIVANGSHLEHWLNGRRVVAVEVGDKEWKRRVGLGPFAAVDGFGAGAGPIVLREPAREVWLRDLKIRSLPVEVGESVELFDARDLTGWRVLGDASYTVDDGSILGQSTAGGHSFLVTERTFGDFVLDLDVKTEGPGNSGIQVRSHVDESGKVFGYQIEIDPSRRSWSGGLYDEGRRGWLQSLEHDEAGRAAFRLADWNHYRIECLGPWLRVRVNGVETVDWFDPLDLEGVLGLQVHSGRDTRVRWRNLRVRDLGERAWEPLFDGESLAGWKRSGAVNSFRVVDGELHGEATGLLRYDGALSDFAIRVRFRPDAATSLADWVLGLRTDASLADAWGEDPIRSTPSGWFLQPDAIAEEVYADASRPETSELVFSAFGPRVAIHLDGKLVAEHHDDPGRLEGGLVIISPMAAGFAIESIERLGDPRQGG